ncbi:MAG: AAA family ATPase [Planctomycetaceae bacterium]
MFDEYPDIPSNHDSTVDGCLDDRRPRKLADIVAQEHIVSRIVQAIKNKVLSHRYLFIGPAGSGKTTLAHALARLLKCPRGQELFDACGTCKICSCTNLSDQCYGYHEWTGAELNDRWEWWKQEGPDILKRPTWLFFLDEAQDLSETHQNGLTHKWWARG